MALAIQILRSHDDLHLLLAHLQAFRCFDRASTFAAKKSIDIVCLRDNEVLVVIFAGKSNIRRRIDWQFSKDVPNILEQL